MKFDLNRIDDQNARLTMVVEQQDYAEKLAENLKNYSKKLNIKGFRAGKTPKSVLTKMYGKGILEETVINVMNDELFKYLESQGIEIFGSPLMAEDAPVVDFDVKVPSDYTFVFDLGIKPKLELDFKYDQPLEVQTISIDPEALDNEIGRYRRMFGESQPVENGTVEDYDLVQLELRPAGSENGEAKEYQINLDRVSGEALELLPGKKEGDSLEVDLEKFFGHQREFIVKNILGQEEDADAAQPLNYKVTVKSITRPQSTELTVGQLSKSVGPQFEDEASFRKMLENRESQQNQARTNDMKKMAIRAAILKANPFDLPEEYLLRYVNSQRQQKIQPDSREARQFLRDTKWSMILNKIAKDAELEVTDKDIQRQVINWVTENVNYMQTDIRKLMGELYNNEYFMSNMKENALEDVVFGHLLPQYTFTQQEVTAEQFEKAFHDLHHELFEHDHSHDDHHHHHHDHGDHDQHTHD